MVCNIEKEIDNFSIRENSKYRNECKECRILYLRQYRIDKNNNQFIINKSIKLTKICNTCNEEKPIEEFIKQKRMCKICKSIYLKNYYNENKKSASLLNKKRYINNMERIKEQTKMYSKNNRDKINKRSRKYISYLRKNDPLYAMKTSISSSIRRALRLLNIPKRFKTAEIIGCSFLELKIHIENNFISDMSWSNRDKWHIDHIIPISFAINEEEVILLNHYSNLRPMWSLDNIVKSNKIDENNNLYINIMKKRSQ